MTHVMSSSGRGASGQVRSRDIRADRPKRANLIVAQHKFNRWYVYFKGGTPKDNVGCGCKTAKSAIRYMHLLKAHGGYVTLYDLGSLIEAEMRTSGLSTADFTLRVVSDTQNNKADFCVLHILYCDRFTVCTDIPAFLRENFLTTLSMRRVAPDTTLSLFFYAEKGESIDYSIAHTFKKKDSEVLYRHPIPLASAKSPSRQASYN